MKVYKLIHVELLMNHRNEILDIGFFSDLNIVNEVINRYRKLPGFSKHPYGFIVLEKDIQEDTEKVLYEAVFYIHNSDYSVEYSEIIGIFLSEEKANLSLEKYRLQNIFFANSSDYEKELIVNKHILNEPSNWREGFKYD